MESKLLELADVLPDLSNRLDNMKVNLVVELISDIQVRHYTTDQSKDICLLSIKRTVLCNHCRQ